MNNKNTIVIVSIVGVLIISLTVTILMISKTKKDEEKRLDSVYSRMSRLESGIETILEKMEQESKKEEATLKTPPSSAPGLKEGEISEDIKGLEESPEEIQVGKVDKSLIKEEKIVKGELKTPKKKPISECMKYKRDLKKCISSPQPINGLTKDFYSEDLELKQIYIFNYYLCSALKTKDPGKSCEKLKDKVDYERCIGFYDAWQIISSNEATCDDSSKFNRICNMLVKQMKKEDKKKLTNPTETCLKMAGIMCNAIKSGNSAECKNTSYSKTEKICKKLVKDFQEGARLSLKKRFWGGKIRR